MHISIKRNYVSILCILICLYFATTNLMANKSNVSSELFKDQPIKIAEYKNGSEEGELTRIRPFGGVVTVPSAIGVDKDNNFYINDLWNSRVVLFDKTGKLVKNISIKVEDLKSDSFFAVNFKIDEKNNIYCTNMFRDIFKIGHDGVIYSKRIKTLDKEIRNIETNFFPIQNCLVYLSPKDNLYILDEQGNLLVDKEAEGFCKLNNVKQVTVNYKPYLLYNNILLETDFKKFLNYFSQKATKNKTIDISLFSEISFIGMDNKDNYYWSATENPEYNKRQNIFLIYNKEGIMVDAFLDYINNVYTDYDPYTGEPYGDSQSWKFYTVNNQGDIYVLTGGKQDNTTVVYKYNRKW